MKSGQIQCNYRLIINRTYNYYPHTISVSLKLGKSGRNEWGVQDWRKGSNRWSSYVAITLRTASSGIHFKTLHQGMIAFCFGDLKLVQVHIQIVVLVYILFSQLYN